MSSVASARRPHRRRSPLPALACLTALAAAGWTVLNRSHGEGLTASATAEQAAAAPVEKPRRDMTRRDLVWLFDANPVLGRATAAGFVRDLPVLALNTVAPEALRPSLVAEAPLPVVPVTPAALAAPLRVATAEATLVPLPVRRPAELQPVARSANPVVAMASIPAAVATAPARAATRRSMTRTQDVFRAAIAEEPSFFDRLFGGGSAPDAARQAAPQALAYADPDSVASSRGRLFSRPSASPSEGVAIYDISASTVTLPSGEVLEAHSGYGDLMDDPRYVHVRMRGATPPGTYDMTEREAPFHGVRAIRLTPVGGSAAIHGRDGILAHTYMLRAQPGASNGCVVFRDYDRFLRSFLRGEVRRLVVVAGNRSPRIDLADRRR